MALLTSGIGYSSASGSVAGLTFEWSDRRFRLRNKVYHPTRSLNRQQVKCANLARFAEQWRTLTEAQRHQWCEAARNLRSTDTRFNGGPIGGLQHYVEINTRLVSAGLGAVVVPPSFASFGQLTPSVPALSVGSSTFSFQMPANPVSNALRVVYASQPLSPGRTNFRGEPMRFIRAVGTQGSFTLFASYSSAWFPLTSSYVGRIIRLRAFILLPSGAHSPEQQLTAVIGA